MFKFLIPNSNRTAFGKKRHDTPSTLPFPISGRPALHVAHNARWPDNRIFIVFRLLNVYLWRGVSVPLAVYKYIPCWSICRYIAGGWNKEINQRNKCEAMQSGQDCMGFNREFDSLGTICRLNRIPSAFSSLLFLLKPGKQWERALVEFQYK